MLPSHCVSYYFYIRCSFLVRFVLGIAVLIGFCNFARCVEKHFGRMTGKFLRFVLYFKSLTNHFLILKHSFKKIFSTCWRLLLVSTPPVLCICSLKYKETSFHKV